MRFPECANSKGDVCLRGLKKACQKECIKYDNIYKVK